jgi:hypothetical protein
MEEEAKLLQVLNRPEEAEQLFKQAQTFRVPEKPVP